MSRMNVTRICLLAVGLLLTTGLAAAKPCPPATSIQVLVSSTYTFGSSTAPSAITPDSSSAYVDGINGVSATLNGCTNDAVINLGNSTRTIGISLQNAVATNSATPSWTSTPVVAKASVTISNLLYAYNANSSYQFTTSAAFSFPAPDGITYQLQFVNPAANVAVQGGLLNQPYYTSLVVVTHTPADANAGTPETWTVTPDNTNMNPAGTPPATQVGGLLKPGQGHQQSQNAGQFSVPFQFTITRK